MASVVDLCNLALSHLGAYAIQALSDAVKEAKECNRLYPFARDASLRDFDWNFASARKVLAESAETVTGWAYVYAYPSDCIAARQIIDVTDGSVYAEWEEGGNVSVRVSGPQGKLPFDVVLNSTKSGRLICTNIEAAELRYTAQVTDPNLFDALFTDALSWRLASELAQPLRGDLRLAQSLFQMYLAKLARARSENANEMHMDPQDTSSFVEARG
ncbi:MAG TPA: hypothetical protein VLI39_07615 [Sedimentisphaerales bacterium]|nr:hypothetical protein [Sedimentisphaerales bacterium]